MNMQELGWRPARCLRSRHTAKVGANKRTKQVELTLQIDRGQFSLYRTLVIETKEYKT